MKRYEFYLATPQDFLLGVHKFEASDEHGDCTIFSIGLLFFGLDIVNYYNYEE